MDKVEAREALLRLARQHESDRDGGYALVRALARAVRDSQSMDRDVLAATLVDLVRNEEPGLWSVALGALDELKDATRMAAIANDMTSPSHGVEWKDHIALSMAWLGQSKFKDMLLAQLRDSLANNRSLSVPTVAAFCRIDRDACLDNAVLVFERAHAKARDISGIVPAFVQNFVEFDEALLPELVRRLRARRPDVARWFAASVDTYLSKPWMIKELGTERVARLRHDVTGEIGATG